MEQPKGIKLINCIMGLDPLQPSLNHPGTKALDGLTAVPTWRTGRLELAVYMFIIVTPRCLEGRRARKGLSLLKLKL